MRTPRNASLPVIDWKKITASEYRIEETSFGFIAHDRKTGEKFSCIWESRHRENAQATLHLMGRYDNPNSSHVRNADRKKRETVMRSFPIDKHSVRSF